MYVTAELLDLRQKNCWWAKHMQTLYRCTSLSDINATFFVAQVASTKYSNDEGKKVLEKGHHEPGINSNYYNAMKLIMVIKTLVKEGDIHICNKNDHDSR